MRINLKKIIFYKLRLKDDIKKKTSIKGLRTKNQNQKNKD